MDDKLGIIDTSKRLTEYLGKRFPAEIVLEKPDNINKVGDFNYLRESKMAVYTPRSSLALIGRGTTQFRFRLTGVPPDQAIMMIDINVSSTVAELKKVIQKAYKLNPILQIQFIFNGKVLPDNITFGRIGVHPRKDVITVMATQAGGRMR